MKVFMPSLVVPFIKQKQKNIHSNIKTDLCLMELLEILQILLNQIPQKFGNLLKDYIKHTKDGY